jgi:hypothetical protein
LAQNNKTALPAVGVSLAWPQSRRSGNRALGGGPPTGDRTMRHMDDRLRFAVVFVLGVVIPLVAVVMLLWLS